jgi:transposase
MHRADVALFCNIDEKTLLDWINGFNSSGIDGLIDRERKGAPRKIERQKVLAEIIPLLDAPAIVGQQH